MKKKSRGFLEKTWEEFVATYDEVRPGQQKAFLLNCLAQMQGTNFKSQQAFKDFFLQEFNDWYTPKYKIKNRCNVCQAIVSVAPCFDHTDANRSGCPNYKILNTQK
jgi:hypothetical protein